MLRPRIITVPSWLPSGTVNMVLLSAALPEDDDPCHEEGATGYPDELIASPPEPVSGVMTVVKKSSDEMAPPVRPETVKFPWPSWRSWASEAG